MNQYSKTVTVIKKVRSMRKRRGYLAAGILAALVLALCCAMLMLGSTIYPVKDVIRALLGEQVQGASFAVGTIRLPRMLAGLLAGLAFGIGGAVFQTMLRNPLANPNVIGITSGSSAAAVFCIVILHANRSVVTLAAIAAGLAAALLIYLLSFRGRSFSIGRMVIVGIAVQAVCHSIILYLMAIARVSDVPAALRWLEGSLNGIQMADLRLLTLAVLALAPAALLMSRHLAMLELGDQAAASLGVHIDRTRVILIVSAVVLVAVATSVTGPIAAVAFLSGPIAKRLVGGGISAILPAGLVGAGLVLAGDLIGQFGFAVRYPVGIITGLIGAPYLIYLLVRMSRRGEL